jgi:sirohydrochlorin ferrochelatase
MQRKTGVLIFTHGSRLKEGNEIMVKLVDHVRRRLGYDLIEPCFMELGKPLIPVAIKTLIRRGATHIFGYAFFLVPGSHLREDIPFIFEQTLKKYPSVTFEISPPMMSDPMMIDFVAKHIESALTNSAKN